MPTYPKNVHLGLLIGHESDKSPCKKNNYQTEAHDLLDSDPSKSTVCCKSEKFHDIKPVELIVSHAFNSQDQKDRLLKASYDSITLANSTSSPQSSQSVAKVIDHMERQTHGSMQTPVSSRRARVGKSMVRAAMLKSRSSAAHSYKSTDTNSKMLQSKSDKNQNERDGDEVLPFRGQSNVIKTEHNIEMQCDDDDDDVIEADDDDDVLIICDASDKSDSIVSDQCASESIQSIDSSASVECTTDQQCTVTKRPAVEHIDEIVDLDAEDSNITTVKRRKIVEFSNITSKKTSPNSYKSLIKPSNPKEYLCKADSEKKTKYMTVKRRVRSHETNTASNGKQNSHHSNGDDCISETIDLSTHQNDDDIPVDEPVNIIDDIVVLELESSSQSSDDSESISIRSSPVEHPTIDKDISMASISDAKKLNGKRESNKSGVARTKSIKTATKTQASRDTTAGKSTLNRKTTAKHESNAKQVNKTKTNRSSKVTAKAATTCNREPCTEQEADTDTTDIESVSSDASFLVNNSPNNHNNNNNDSLADKNTKSTQSDAMNESSSVLSGKMATATRKTKSRGTKFSSKKKHRVKQPTIEECILPSRVMSAIPRWSNGWQWQGEPYQGKVFLNVGFLTIL